MEKLFLFFLKQYYNVYTTFDDVMLFVWFSYNT